MSIACRSRQASIAAEPVSPDELQGEVLEGERRTMEQFEQPQPLVKLHQRCHRSVPEIAVSRRRKPLQFFYREAVTCKQGEESGRKLRVGQSRTVRQAGGAEFAQPVRD